MIIDRFNAGTLADCILPSLTKKIQGNAMDKFS